MSNLILKTPELQAIEKSKAEQIKNTFNPMAEMLSKFEGSYNEIIKESEEGITKEIITKAKRLRIDISRVRIATEKVRKTQKEEYLRAGKAIDGVANILKWAVIKKENKLKEIEKYFEIQEQKRLDDLQLERVKILSQYIDDAEERDLSSMNDDVWEAYLSTKKRDYESRIEAERKAEEERKERERRAKIHSERKNALLNVWQFIDNKIKSFDFSEFTEKEFNNIKESAQKEQIKYKKEQERLHKEAERLRKEKEELERKRKEAEEKARKEAEEYKAKIEFERKEKERLIRIETEKRAKFEAEVKAKKLAEEKRIREQRQAELQKSDADKLHDFIIDLQNLKTKYSFKSQKYIKKYTDVKVFIDKVIKYIR